MTSKTKNNTLNALNLFEEEIKSSLLFHIPHASKHIPSYDFMDKKLVDKEVDLLTDWATDEIFNLKNCNKIITPFSRVFCDVERLPDEQEEMYEKGRGFYYTHSDDGQVIRDENKDFKQFIYQNYYLPHHNLLENWCDRILQKYGTCTIIDCHSFSETPLKSEFNQNAERPDICIGTDKLHTPKRLIFSLKNQFERLGFSVAIDKPYSGTIFPLKYCKKENRPNSVMIEINKRLYMKEGEVLPEKVKLLNKYIYKIFTPTCL